LLPRTQWKRQPSGSTWLLWEARRNKPRTFPWGASASAPGGTFSRISLWRRKLLVAVCFQRAGSRSWSVADQAWWSDVWQLARQTRTPNQRFSQYLMNQPAPFPPTSVFFVVCVLAFHFLRPSCIGNKPICGYCRIAPPRGDRNKVEKKRGAS
jgi:hypothetical protein